MTARGCVITAPASGSGKTMITLGLLRALRGRGVDIRAAKSGPDYIDPAFHAAACGRSSVNLDPWAMHAASIMALAAAQGGDVLIVEGAMGVLDAASDGHGSVADLAATLDLPVIMVLDVARQGQSAVLSVAGLARLRPDLRLAGVILNRVGSERHNAIIATELARHQIPLLGAVPRNDTLALPERHLGLVQAGETEGLDRFLDGAAEIIGQSVDLEALTDICTPLSAASSAARNLAPLGQRIAVAQDPAFAFAYPHVLSGWRAQGAEIALFSPLDDEAPDRHADAIYLPGGYPELHAGRLAASERFIAGLRAAAARDTLIYGECGGYMVMGDHLIDADGHSHAMAGLLPLATSFAKRQRHLGYRRLMPHPGAPWQGPLMGHEFHYSTEQTRPGARSLFSATDAQGKNPAEMGQRIGRVMGSYAHVIAPS